MYQKQIGYHEAKTKITLSDFTALRMMIASNHSLSS